MTTVTLLIFLAVLVQVTLTLVQYLRLLRSRLASVKAGTADLSRVGYDPAGWPEKSRLIANSVTSQFELPVLFYVAVLFSFVLGAVGWVVAVLAWLFVISRVIHATIHTTTNNVPPRLQMFFFGFLVMVLFWVYLAWHTIRGWLLLA